MYKKFLVPLILALVAALAIGGVAYAAGADTAAKATFTSGQPENGITAPGAAEGLNRGVGQITAIGNNQFTIQLKRGGIKVILVDGNTRYFKADGSAGSFADLKVGLWVAGRVSNSGGNLTARVVILLPEGYDPTRKNAAARGEVTAIDDSRFSLHTLRGQDVTILVDAHTTYAGQIHSFSDLQVGMKAVVAAQKLDDGSLLALMVGVRADIIRHTGTITQVDPAAGSFGLKSLQGENLTFQVDGNVQYFGQVKSLADLQTGMLAIVAAKQLDDGSYLAVRVTAHSAPLFDVTAAGKVTAIDTAAFTIQALDGSTYTFQVTEQTRFRSRGGQVKSLDDLSVGMGVGVAARDLGDGQLQAQVVIARVR